MRGLFLLVIALWTAMPAAAEVLTGKEAKRLLFSERGHKVLTSNNLTDVQRKIVRGIIPLMADGRLLPYLDVPFQHGSPRILKRMRRPAAAENNLERIAAWREIAG